MTDGEKKLWGELRNFRKLYGIHVRKQVPIGPYVADFAIQSAKLIIEIDGHFHVSPHRRVQDGRRDAWFGEAGYRVLHLTTGDLDTAWDGCIEEILRELGLMN